MVSKEYIVATGKTIDQLLLPSSIVEDPIERDLGYEAWDRAHDLMFRNPVLPASQRIRDFYCFGYYMGEVRNGGHSQLVYNMDIRHKRSPFLINGAILGASTIGVPEFSSIGRDFAAWIQENPLEALEQTGFDGGRADFLDELDERVSALETGLQMQLNELLFSSTDEVETKFLRDCIDRTGRWRGHLSALELVWLMRSEIVLAIPDSAYKSSWDSQFER